MPGVVLAQVIGHYRSVIGMSGCLSFVNNSRKNRGRLSEHKARYGAVRPQATLSITCGCVSMCQEIPPSHLGTVTANPLPLLKIP